MYRHIAAFVDLLGQRKALERFKLFPDMGNPEEVAELESAIFDSIGAVNRLNKTFSGYFTVFSTANPTPVLTDTQKKLHAAMTRTAIKVQRFSDGLVFFVSLADGIPVTSVFGLLAACGSLCLFQLMRKEPIRVGVDLHWGVELNENEIYGPVVANSYRLEHEIAQFPRVVVGDEVIRYLQVCANHDPKDITEQYTRDLSQCTLEMLTQDTDGYAVVDYLGEGFRKHAADQIDSQGPLMAYEFVKQQADVYKHAKEKTAENTKLALRYTLLLDYFEHRLPLWGVTLEK